jgi:Ca2+-binding RTX toxin-like protein
MATFTGTAGNDAWTVVNPGTFTLDGLGGTDTLNLGTSLRSSYTITKTSDGAVHVDTVSGASGALHATLYNMEVLAFNNGSDKLDLTTYFADTTPPTLASVTPANLAGSVAVGANIVMTFSEPIQRGTGTLLLVDAAGTTLATFDAATSPQISVSGSTLTLNPSLDLVAGTRYTLVVPAGGVKDSVNNPYAGETYYSFTTAGASTLMDGTAGNDSLSGSAANNLLAAGAGNDTIDGGAGTDTALYSGKFSDYTLATGANASTLTDGRLGATKDGADKLVNVERLQFTDENVALDLGATQAAGEAVLLMAATLGPGFVADKGWAGTFIRYFDSGATLLDGANLLVNAGIVSAFAGGSDNASFVKFIYNNVYGTPPDAATLVALVAPLDNHSTTQAAWMADMAASAANQQHVNLVAYAALGLQFL